MGLGLQYDGTKKATLDLSGKPVSNAYPYRYVDPSSGAVTDHEAAPEITVPQGFVCVAGGPGRVRGDRRSRQVVTVPDPIDSGAAARVRLRGNPDNGHR